jgi:formylglycine-generating enzyme required for sulfatase activity
MRNVTEESAVWKMISPSASENRTITCFLDEAVAGVTDVKVAVSAWAIENPPDYLVADLLPVAQPGSERYYPSADFLPGGVLGNTDYRTTKLVMRKIMAANVPWSMGTNEDGLNSGTSENAHDVTLTNNYYIGVFEVTQAQFMLVAGTDKNNSYFKTDGAMRPVNRVAYNEIRCAPVGTTAHKGGDWPGSPYQGSFLDLLNRRTGLNFDLPGEAQWEFACRAGNEPGYWGNGKVINKGDLGDPNMPGRHRYNGGYLNKGAEAPANDCLPENGLATVGSYAENDWGLYDMHGNVFELCLDWFENDITKLNGAVNIDTAATSNTLAGKAAGKDRVRRGGSYHVQSKDSRSTNRLAAAPATQAQQWGFRLACHAGSAEENVPVSTATHDTAVRIVFGRISTEAVAELEARSRSMQDTDAVSFDSRPPFGFILILK